LTLLTYNSKHIVQSTVEVQTTSATLVDDTEAKKAFILTQSKTVLIFYQANCLYGVPMGKGGIYGISVDGSDVGVNYDSPMGYNFPARTCTFWIGTLAAGSHTIKGRYASAVSGEVTRISNRILLIYIFNGDEFQYIDDATQSQTTSAMTDDPQASVTFTPSGACKALYLYNAGNIHGTTEDVQGKRIRINVAGSDYSQAEKSPGSSDYSDGTFTCYAGSLSAVSTTVKGRFGAWIPATVTVSRRQLGVLLLADSTLLDIVTSDVEVSTTSPTLVDDPEASISRTPSDTRELLVVAMGTKRATVDSNDYGECYGIMTNAVDRQHSRGSAPYYQRADSAATCWAEEVAAGSQSVKGRFSHNYTDTSVTAKISSRRVIALWFLPVKTLLTFNSKYVVSSTTPATTTLTALQDDPEASQNFSLATEKTVLVIYQANNVIGTEMPPQGMQNAINIDGVDYANSWDSPLIASDCARNCVFIVGILAAGSHTIKGRFASMASGYTATISNRVLLIIIFDGNEFRYFDDPTTSTNATTTFADDPYAIATFLPSAACKALILYNAANSGATESAYGKKAAINIDGVDYAQAEKSPSSGVGASERVDSVFTCHALSLSAAQKTVKGRFANAGTAATITIHRRQFAVLLLADSTLLDISTSTTQVTTTSSTLVDDTEAILQRTITETRELLVVAMGTKRNGTSSSLYGECYGIKIEANDRANSRGSPYGTAYANSAATAYAEQLTVGSRTVKGRFSNNTGTETAKIDARQVIALWLVPLAPPVPVPPVRLIRPIRKIDLGPHPRSRFLFTRTLLLSGKTPLWDSWDYLWVAVL